MKKNRIFPIIALFALVVALLLCIFVIGAPKNNGKNDKSSYILSDNLRNSPFLSVKISNNEDVTRINLENSNFYVENYENITINEANFREFYAILRNLSSGERFFVENAEKIEENFAKNGKISVAVENNTEKYEFFIGDDAARYGNAYLVSGDEVFLVDARIKEIAAALPFYLFSSNITDEAEGALLRAELTNQNGRFVIEKTADVYHITAPRRALLSREALPLLESALSLSGTIAAKLENAALPEYARLSVTTRAGSFTLSASIVDGKIYVHKAGTPLIFEVAAQNVGWINADFWTLLEKMPLMPHIDGVERVMLESAQGTAVFSLDGAGASLTVTARDSENGAAREKPVDQSNFRVFYQSLLLARYDEFYEGALPSSAPLVLSIIYDYADGRVDRIDFYKADARRVFMSVNGAPPFYAYERYTQKILADVDTLLQGGKVTPYL